MSLVRASLMLLTTLAACSGQRQYGYVNARGEQALPPVTAEVVSAERARATSTPGQLRAIGIRPGSDSATVVAEFLRQADEAEAEMVSDLAIYLHTAQGLECRTAIVPETVTRSEWHPPHEVQVTVPQPVRRMETTYERRCHTTTRLETKHVTEYQRRCHTTTRPVTRTRTTYSGYGSNRSPRTETYTDYERHEECRNEPTMRTKTEYVPHEECKTEPVTSWVTRYEFQRETRFVPGRLETIRRQRLRELEPVCYPLDATAAAPGANAGDRIEGRLHRRR